MEDDNDDHSIFDYRQFGTVASGERAHQEKDGFVETQPNVESCRGQWAGRPICCARMEGNIGVAIYVTVDKGCTGELTTS